MVSPALIPYLRNAALAAALAVASVVVNGGLYLSDGSRQKQVTAYFGDAASLRTALTVWWLFGALMIIGLVIQHRWPLAALTLVAIGGVGHYLDPRFSLQPLDLAVPIVLFTVASLARRRRVPILAVVVIVAGVYLMDLLAEPRIGLKAVPADKMLAPVVTEPFLADLLAAAGRSFQVLLVLVLAVAMGDGVRSRRAHLRMVEQRAADLEREQHQREQLAVAAERARLNREMHDVVAHGLAVIVAQAQGAAAALRRHPDRAQTALEHVIATGRSSLTEMRRLLVSRRQPGHDGDAEPEPGVSQVAGLIDQIRAAGLVAELTVDGGPVPLPALVDVSAYRIVQEALTNALKHAGAGAQVAVRLRFAGDRLEVEITDDGAGWSQVTEGRGYGLRGIAERVGLLGGELSVGPRESGGFRVRARLPIEAGA